MKVVVLGGQGFVGSYICNELLDQGHEVYSIDNYSRYGKIDRPQDYRGGFCFYEVDIKSPRYLSIMAELQPEIIVSAAAEVGGIDYFSNYQYDVLDNNNLLNHNIFRSAIGCNNLKRLIVLSSIMVYSEMRNWKNSHEGINPILPTNSYALHKIVLEESARHCYEQYKVPYTILRLCNVLGVGEDKSLIGNEKMTMSHVVPDLINKLMIEKQFPLPIKGDGSQQRMYINGTDVANAVSLVLDNMIISANQTYNLGTKEPTSVHKLAEIIFSKVLPNYPVKLIPSASPKADIQLCAANSDKIRQELGWEESMSLEDSIEEVVDYIKSKHETISINSNTIN